MTEAEARRILVESGESDEKLKLMSRAERKAAARKILENKQIAQANKPGAIGGTSSAIEDAAASKKDTIANKKDAKEIARNAKFRQVLQDIFAKEAYKLANGIEYYSKVTDQEVRHYLHPELYTENTSGLSRDEIMDESDDEALLEMMLRKNTEKDKLETQKSESDSESESDTEFSRTVAQKEMEKGKGLTTEQQPQVPEKKYYVRKTVKQKDGSTKVEIIKDPAMVKYYIEKKEKWERDKDKKKGKRFHGAAASETFKSGNKEHRRLQDMYRRFLKEVRGSNVQNTKKKKRSTLTQTSYQVTSAAADKKKEREEKARLKKLQRQEKEKEKRAKLKKNASVSTEGSKIKITLPEKEEKPLPKPVDTPIQVQGLKIQIPASVIEQSNAKSSKKRERPSSSSKPAKKSKTSKPPLAPITRPSAIVQKEQDALEYLSPKPQTSKRRKTTGDQLAEVFTQVLDAIEMDPNATPFKFPVDNKQFPDYRKIISQPMDLSTMKKRIANLFYVDERAFRADFERIIGNARKYCTGRFQNVVDAGEALLAHFNALMAQYAEKISQIENADSATPISAASPNDLFK